MPENDTPAPDGGNNQLPVVAIPQQPHNEAAQGERDSKQEHDIQLLENREKILFRVAIFGVLIAAASTIVSTLQWDVMRDQLADARASGADAGIATLRAYRLTKQQADAMTLMASANNDMARAAKTSAVNSDRIARSSAASVKAAQESERLDQRAWIGLSDISGKPVVGEPLKITVTLRNSGRTPATATETLIAVGAADQGQRPVFKEAMIGGRRVEPVTSHSVLPPNGNATLTGSIYDKTTMKPVQFTQANVDSVTNGSLVLYVHALARYDDIFGRHHWTMLCYFYDPNRTAGQQYVACDWGNLVDRDGEPPPQPPV